jgi:hypothetical protein
VVLAAMLDPFGLGWVHGLIQSLNLRPEMRS